MKPLDRSHWLVVVAFLAIVTVTCYFAARTARSAVNWHSQRDEKIQVWMTVRHVAHAYRVPPYILYKALRLPPMARDRRPLRQIAVEQHRPAAEVIAILQDAVVHARPPYPPPPLSDPGVTP
jgi:hypothetical protein